MFQLLFHFMYFYQRNIVYWIYICICLLHSFFKYLFLLSENKESHLYYYYIKVVRISLDHLPRFSSLPICFCKIPFNCSNLKQDKTKESKAPIDEGFEQ